MSPLQKILKYLLSEDRFKKIEATSRTWFMECGKCKFSKSYWDAGGVRMHASGKKILFGRCPQCKKYAVFNVVKKI